MILISILLNIFKAVEVEDYSNRFTAYFSDFFNFILSPSL